MQYHLGFLGGGQLARMSIQAAQRMGLQCVSLDNSDSTPASQIADHLCGSLKDPAAIKKVFESAEFVTLENEFIPAYAIEDAIARGRHSGDRLVPRLESLRTVQDKLTQREALLRHGVPSPLAMAIEADGENVIENLGFPLVLKARFGGYDGKGTRYAHSPEEWNALRSEWGHGGWLAEEFVPFQRELAVMVAIGSDYAHCFPTVQTVQTHSVCDLVFPCSADASEIALAAVRAVEGRGLFGVELFELADGRFLVNELAPRPHNSGHYTLDWGGPSQFEYHIRTVLDLPATKPESSDFAVMANLLGQTGAKQVQPAIRAALYEPNSFVHWYGKEEAKPGRKMGHINLVGRGGSSVDEVVAAVRRSRSRFYEAWIAG